MSKDMAASVHQRLLNHARKEGVRFNDVLQRYALERWLYRLSKSEHSERFILKGALMLIAWELPVTRPTRDIDMLAWVQNDLGGIRLLVADLCRVQCEDDGLIFAAESVNYRTYCGRCAIRRRARRVQRFFGQRPNRHADRSGVQRCRYSGPG